jgi:hypothetical protein
LAARLTSPKNVTVYLAKGLPDPHDEHHAYERAAIRAIPPFVSKTGGRALVLFTSHRMMDEATRVLAPWFREQGITLLSQSSGRARSKLIETGLWNTGKVGGASESRRILQSATGHPDETLASYNRALAIFDRLARENPTVTAFQRGLADSHNNVGLLQSKTGHPEEALASYGRA